MSKNMYAQCPHIALLLMALMARPTLSQATKNYPAVVLLYDKNIKSYTSVEQETMNRYGLLRYGENREVITCPAKHSETGKVSQDVLERSTEMKNYSWCENSYAPSMVENKNGTGFNVGFFFIEDENKFRSECLPLFSSTFDNTDILPRMHIYEIETNRATLQTTRTRHRIISHKHFFFAIPKPCEKFTNMVEDGIETRLTQDIAKHYSKEKQKKLLKGYLYSEDFFIPVQLVPIDDFTDKASRQATCTYFNTVPIWSSVAEVVKELEMFIRRVADVLDVGALEVVTRTFDILELLQWESKLEQKTYLDFENETIPVPRIFMKIIYYRVAFPITNVGDSNSESKKYDYYYMIIGVYNTNFKDRDVKHLPFNCNYNICLIYGWNVNFGNEQTKRIFCCDVEDTSSLEVLKLNEISGKPLDLNQIPVEIDENGEIERSLQVPILR